MLSRHVKNIFFRDKSTFNFNHLVVNKLRINHATHERKRFWPDYDFDERKRSNVFRKPQISYLSTTTNRNSSLPLSQAEPKNSYWRKMVMELTSFIEENGHSNVPQNYPDHPPLGIWVHNQRRIYKRYQNSEGSSDDHASNDRISERFKALSSIGFEFNPLEAHWRRMFSKLKEYLKEGKQILRSSEDPSEVSLHQWVVSQRLKYKSEPKKLSDDQIKMLNSVGFVWDTRETEWYEKLDTLKEYKARHGHVNVPLEYPDNPSLGHWIHNQRREYRYFLAGKRSYLTEERKKALEEIGFNFGVTKPTWNASFEELKKFAKEEGHPHVPLNVPEKYRILRNWVTYQRHEYQLFKKGDTQTSMTTERIKKLKGIGFEFEPSEVSWQTKFSQLKELSEKLGHFDLSHLDEYKALASWVHRQRKGYKAKTLAQDRINKLNSIGFPWNKKRGNWEQSYQELKDFYQNNGHLNVPIASHPKLYSWMRNQRAWYYKLFMKMRKEPSIKPRNYDEMMKRVKLMEDLGFVWDLQRETWFEKYSELQQYYVIHGHFFITEKGSSSNRALKVWIIKQKDLYQQYCDPNCVEEKKVKLLRLSPPIEERIEALKRIDGSLDFF